MQHWICVHIRDGSSDLLVQFNGIHVLQEVHAMRMHPATAVVLLGAFLSLAILEFQSGTEVHDCVASAAIRSEDMICPAPVCSGEILGVGPCEEPAVQLSENMCHVQGLRACKMPAGLTSLLHLVENPLVVREGGLDRAPLS